MSRARIQWRRGGEKDGIGISDQVEVDLLDLRAKFDFISCLAAHECNGSRNILLWCLDAKGGYRLW